MFIGSIPREARIYLENNVLPCLNGEKIVVGCSGNYTIDKFFSTKGFDVYSNDVSIYSKVISDSDIELNEIRLLFCDLDYKKINEITEKLNEKVFDEKKDKVVFVNFYRFVDVMTRIKLAHNVKNHSVSFLKMIEICEKWLEQENQN